MAELLEYRTAARAPLTIKVAEDWLLGPEVTLETESTFYLRARDLPKGKWLVVESRQNVPLCKGRGVKLQGASMHVSAEPIHK
jgi:hypothetical protein